jgi:hypothetical protein
MHDMKTATSLLTLAIALTGCTIVPDPPPPPQPSYLQDGRPGLKVNCGGAMNDWDTCFAAAHAACPSGIVVDRRDENAAGIVPFGKDGKFGHGLVIRRTLVFACK